MRVPGVTTGACWCMLVGECACSVARCVPRGWCLLVDRWGLCVRPSSGRSPSAKTAYPHTSAPSAVPHQPISTYACCVPTAPTSPQYSTTWSPTLNVFLMLLCRFPSPNILHSPPSTPHHATPSHPGQVRAALNPIRPCCSGQAGGRSHARAQHARCHTTSPYLPKCAASQPEIPVPPHPPNTWSATQNAKSAGQAGRRPHAGPPHQPVLPGFRLSKL